MENNLQTRILISIQLKKKLLINNVETLLTYVITLQNFQATFFYRVKCTVGLTESHTTQVIFQALIHSLGLSISLRVIRSTEMQFYTHPICHYWVI